jgi:hypothetical protein
MTVALWVHQKYPKMISPSSWIIPFFFTFYSYSMIVHWSMIFPVFLFRQLIDINWLWLIMIIFIPMISPIIMFIFFHWNLPSNSSFGSRCHRCCRSCRSYSFGKQSSSGVHSSWPKKCHGDRWFLRLTFFFVVKMLSYLTKRNFYIRLPFLGGIWMVWVHDLPSGKLTVCHWTWQFIVDLPIKNGDDP